jgi:hypothetical protein
MQPAVAIAGKRLDAEQIVGRGLAQDALERPILGARLDMDHRPSRRAGEPLEP